MKKYLKPLRQRLRSSIRFFSSKNKFQRECWIVKKFLDLKTTDGMKKSDQDPPDVLFKDARFEVFEILDEGRKRNDEHRQRAKKIEEAEKNNSLSPLLEPYEISFFSKDDLIHEVLKKITIKESKYAPAVTASLDLLIYINFRTKVLDMNSQVTLDIEASFNKWRSVSVLTNSHGGFVIYAGQDAPAILQDVIWI
ncbi:MAG: DUF1780 domain-containing protein [Proteobacteria bacterium]|nr:DUF1780 domain-containing protein [Pseudomonadota bacterium]